MNSTSTTTSSATTNYYHYDPSVVAAAVFAALFGISSIHHFYQLIRSRGWFMIPFLVGGLFETVGYATRAINATQSPHYGLGLYIIQTILILVAPALLAASIYMTFGSIVGALDAEEHSMIRRNKLTKIFVLGDILSFVIQASGAGKLSSQNKNGTNQKGGKLTVVGGLAIQVLFFGFFMILSLRFYWRTVRKPTAQSSNPAINWRTHLFVLYTASILIMIRSVVRIIEYVQGDYGYLLVHEAFLYSFDAALMFSVFVLFNLKHPSEIKNIITGKMAIGILRMKMPATFEPAKKPGKTAAESSGSVLV